MYCELPDCRDRQHHSAHRLELLNQRLKERPRVEQQDCRSVRHWCEQLSTYVFLLDGQLTYPCSLSPLTRERYLGGTQRLTDDFRNSSAITAMVGTLIR